MLNVGDIIKGHVNEITGKNKDLVRKRLEICRRCPIFSSKLGGICNPNLWIDPSNDNVSTEYRPGYRRGCGCRLLAKTSLPNAKCIAGKW